MGALTERRVAYLKSLTDDFYDGVKTEGPQGGSNAKRIPGWSLTPSAGWTRAAHLAGYKSIPWWHGSAPTPSRAFPTKLVRHMKDEEV